MPRKDPITGCSVLTLPEFFAEEDKRDNKEPGSTMQEILSDMDKSIQEEEERYKDPATALEAITTAVHNWNEQDSEDQIEAPKTVLEVLEVKCTNSFHKTGMRLKVRATKQDDSEGVFVYDSWSTSGSFYEPPDGEDNLSWE